MKKLLLMIVATVFSVAASAQTTKMLQWGVEAGMNFNTLSFDKEMLESGNRAGFFVGPKVKVNVPLLGFGLDGALIYSLNSAKVESDGISKSKNLSYLEIPMNVRYTFGLKLLSVYLATGPQFNYCLSSSSTIDDFYGTMVEEAPRSAALAPAISRSTWGWNVGAGVEVMDRFQLGVTYTIPISNSGDLAWEHAGNIISNFKQKTVKVRLAYFF